MEPVKPYNTEEGKTEEVERMFDAIAPSYDAMNSYMSLGLHRKWRDKSLDEVQESFAEREVSPAKILDIACGTGDVAFELLKRFPEAEVTGVDLSEGMLRLAEERKNSLDGAEKKRLNFEKGDCLNLKFKDDSFDLVTVAYGVRNFEQLAECLEEIRRVLRKDGMICIIELSEPTNSFLKGMYKLYSGVLIPIVGKYVSGDSRAYKYLPESIAAAPQRYDLVKLMNKAGFSDCTWNSMTFGVITRYVGTKH